ncbi:MAG: MFS transporter [Rhodocyclaceae bacterium]|nr:MFS transporter [Rhodocyclaceae bacterium]
MHTARYIAYALPGLPLALFALPLYVHMPKLYAEHAGLPLALIGGALLGVRCLDALCDPLLGRWCDRHRRRKPMLLLALPFLISGGFMLLQPPSDASLPWLLCGLLLAYAGYALAQINHQAWGAEFPPDDGGRLRATAWREGAALLGVLLAAGLPNVLADDLAQGLARLLWLFVPVLCIATFIALAGVPSPAARSDADDGATFFSPWRSASFRRLVLIYGINGVAAAVPATLVLFYVADVLHAGARSGAFLLAYFCAGALALPFWAALAGRIGRLATWRWAMLLAITSFAATPFLSSGDAAIFAVVCVLSGIALGADLAMPPALLAEHVAQHGQAATSYGWWTAATKLTLALAAGIALPLVSAFGYVPEQGGAAALAWVYGATPLLLKALALWALLSAQTLLQPLDQGASA